MLVTKIQLAQSQPSVPALGKFCLAPLPELGAAILRESPNLI